MRDRSAGFQTGLGRPYSSSAPFSWVNAKPVWKPALRSGDIPCLSRLDRVILCIYIQVRDAAVAVEEFNAVVLIADLDPARAIQLDARPFV